jgi:hypothetical protein
VVFVRTFNLALIVCVGFLASLGMLGCGASGPPASLAAVQTTDLGVIGSNPEILGRDGGYSGTFAGNSVWVFGDTFLANPNADGQTLISDSWESTTDLNATAGITGFQAPEDSAGAPAMLLSYTASEQAFNAAHQGNPCQQQPCGARWALWPGPVVADTARNRALIFYQVVMAQPGNFNFAAVGYSVAIWQNFADQPQRPTINPTAEHPDLLFGQSDPDFGSAAFATGDTLYAYACNGNILGAPCVLGQVALENVLNVSAWTFYAGNGNWSGNVADAVTVMNAAPIMNVSWNDYLQCYVAVYNAPFSQDVMIRTSPKPEGPWSQEVIAFEALAPTSGGSSVHDALAHPEFNGNDGQIMYVTYSHSTGAFTSDLQLVSVEVKAVNPQPQSR